MYLYLHFRCISKVSSPTLHLLFIIHNEAYILLPKIHNYRASDAEEEKNAPTRKVDTFTPIVSQSVTRQPRGKVSQPLSLGSLA